MFAVARVVRAPTVASLSSIPARTMAVEARLAQLGYKLPTPAKPVASYIMCNRVGNLIYTGAFC